MRDPVPTSPRRLFPLLRVPRWSKKITSIYLRLSSTCARHLVLASILQNRLQKADRIITFTPVGMNRYGLHPLACIRLLSAFVHRVRNMEWPFWNQGAPQLEKIRLCPKRGVCLFLGFSTNSRVDTLDAVTGLVPPAIRQQVLSMQRSKPCGPFGIRTIGMTSLWPTFDMGLKVRPRFDRPGFYIWPTRRLPLPCRIMNCSVNRWIDVSRGYQRYSSHASIRRLLHLKSPFKFIRVILMWLLLKWGSFY